MYAVGIDLGTTWTAAAIWDEGRAEVLALGDRANTVPSAVMVEDSGRPVVGEAAQQRRRFAPADVATEFKRRFGDPVPLVVGGTSLKADELTGLLLGSVLETVSNRLGGAPDQVVVTVPATWRDFRHNTMSAVVRSCRLAEDRVVLLPEPVAAAIHYAGLTRVTSGSTVAVYDLGGGTFDATVVRKTDTGFEIVGEPRGTDVGGIDVDDALFGRIRRDLGGEWSHDDPAEAVARALGQLRIDVTQAKEALSSASSAVISSATGQDVHQVRLTRTELEADAEPLLAPSVDLLADVVRAAGLQTTDLDRVLLVGGASRMPLVCRLVEARLGIPIAVDEHPKFAVCLGAAVAAGSRLERHDISWSRSPAVRSSYGSSATAPPEHHELAVAMDVDLEASGLTQSAEVPLRPAVSLESPRRSPTNQPLTIDIDADDEYGKGSGRLMAAAAMAAVIGLLALAFFVLRR